MQGVLALAMTCAIPATKVQGQCTPDQGCPFPGFQTVTANIRSSNAFGPLTTMHFAGHYTQCYLREGETYEWSTRNSDRGLVVYDSQLTLYPNTGTERLCYGNDPNANGASITWTAPQNMAVNLYLSKNNCQTDTATSVVTWRCVSCEQLPIVMLPSFGPSDLECGNTVRLQDPRRRRSLPQQFKWSDHAPRYWGCGYILVRDLRDRIHLRSFEPL